jgi:hypothetical protein
MQQSDSQTKTHTPAPTLFSSQAHTIPPLLTKKWLCDYFQIPHTGAGSFRLRTQVLTDDILHDVGIDCDQYKTIRIFTAVQSRRIKEILGL